MGESMIMRRGGGGKNAYKSISFINGEIVSDGYQYYLSQSNVYGMYTLDPNKYDYIITACVGNNSWAYRNIETHVIQDGVLTQSYKFTSLSDYAYPISEIKNNNVFFKQMISGIDSRLVITLLEK